MSRWIPLVLVGACCPPEPAKKVTHTLPHRLAKRAHDASAAFCKYADTFIDEANSLPRDRSRELTASCHIRTFAPTMFSRGSGSDTRINEPGKRAEPVLKIPSAFGAHWRKPQIDTSTRIPDLTRYKDRICLGNITDARRHLHRRTKKIVAFLDGFAGMNTDPYTDRGLADFVI